MLRNSDCTCNENKQPRTMVTNHWIFLPQVALTWKSFSFVVDLDVHSTMNLSVHKQLVKEKHREGWIHVLIYLQPRLQGCPWAMLSLCAHICWRNGLEHRIASVWSSMAHLWPCFLQRIQHEALMFTLFQQPAVSWNSLFIAMFKSTQAELKYKSIYCSVYEEK